MAIGRRPAARSAAIAARQRVRAQLEALVRRDPDQRRRARGPASCTPSRSSCAPRSRRRRGAPARSGAPGQARVRRRRCRPPGARPASAISDEVEAVSVSRPSNAVRQPERLAQPVDDDLLELGADRRGPPQHRVLAERRRQHLAEDPGAGRGRREVGEEARVLPVRGVRLDQAAVVGQDRLDRLRAPRARVAGNSGRSDAGLDRPGRRPASRWSRGSRPSGRRPRARPPGTRRAACRRSAAVGRRGAGRSRARVYRGERLLDGVADLGEDVADLRAEQDQAPRCPGSRRQQEQADDEGAGQRQPPRSRPGRPHQGGVGELVVQALLVGLSAVEPMSTIHQTSWTRPSQRGRRQDEVEQGQEQAEADPAPERLLDRERTPVEGVADLDPEDALPDRRAATARSRRTRNRRGSGRRPGW